MIRKMADKEADAVVALWLKTSIHSHSFIDKSYWLDKQFDMKNVYIPNSETWIYDSHGEIVGFYSLVENQLAALFVLPDFHRQGIGSQLLHHAQKQRKSLQLTVYAENESAYAFYSSHGFTVCSHQDDDATGHKEYVMECINSLQ